MKKYWWMVLALLLVLGGGAAGFYGHRKSKARTSDQDNLVHARALVEKKEYDEALNLFLMSRSQGFPAGEREEWLRVQRDALLALDRIPELAGLYSNFAHLVHESEDAMLKLYSLFATSDNLPAAEKILRSADTDQPAWLLAQAGVLTLRGFKDEVVDLLSEVTFEAEQEAERVYLLCSAIKAPADRAKVLDALDAEMLKYPLVRIARARHFESNGLGRQASFELSAALRDSPEDKRPARAQDAAQFFLRNHNSRAALGIWFKFADQDRQSWVLAKAWSRLVAPAELKSAPEGSEELTQLVTVFSNLDKNEFYPHSSGKDWNEYGVALQELYWLQWLELVRLNRLEPALEMLKTFPDPPVSHNRFLGRVGYLLLNYKVNGTFNMVGSDLPNPRREIPVMKSLAKLENLCRQNYHKGNKDSLTTVATASKDEEVIELAKVLDGPVSFPFLCLLAGWEEAALRLAGTHRPPLDNTALCLRWAQALQRCRGNQMALTYLSSLPKSDVIEMTIAEVLVAQGKSKEAEPRLGPLAKKEGLEGSHAARLLAAAQLEQKKYNEALKTILGNRALSLSVAGHELAARVYLAAKDEKKALKVLKAIPDSPLAKDVFAAQAYRKGDLETAARLRNELAQQFPDRADFRAAAAQVLEELNPSSSTIQ